MVAVVSKASCGCQKEEERVAVDEGQSSKEAFSGKGRSDSTPHMLFL